jgi:hypothetical protein
MHRLRANGGGRRHAIRRLSGALLHFVAAAVIVGWAIGRVLSDRSALSQWLLWIPTPAAIAAAGLGIALVLPHARRLRLRTCAWLLTATYVLAFFLFIEHRFFRHGTHPAGGVATRTLRLMHWNVDGPGEGAGRYIDEIQRVAPDITILTHPGAVLWDERTREMIGDGRPWRIAGFGVVTRLPIIGGRLLHVSETISAAMVQVDATEVLGRPLTIYMIDLPSEPRIPRMRVARELRAALDALEGVPPPDVVVGDFNITRGSAALAALFPGFRHAFHEAGHGYGATFPHSVPLYHIDHTLLAPAVEATGYDIIATSVGRHRAQAVTLTTASSP